jgi:hypothetical protein
MIGFEFHQGLKNSVTMFQVIIWQPAMTNPIDSPAWLPIDSPARLPIGTPSMSTRSSALALCEIWTTKPKESAWLGVAIGKRSIPPASTQRSIGLWWQNVDPLHQVALHLSLDFSTVRPQGWICGTNRDSRSRTGARWAIDKKCTTTSERTYSGSISKARPAQTGQYDIFIPSMYAYSI